MCPTSSLGILLLFLSALPSTALLLHLHARFLFGWRAHPSATYIHMNTWNQWAFRVSIIWTDWTFTMVSDWDFNQQEEASTESEEWEANIRRHITLIQCGSSCNYSSTGILSPYLTFKAPAASDYRGHTSQCPSRDGGGDDDNKTIRIWTIK